MTPGGGLPRSPQLPSSSFHSDLSCLHLPILSRWEEEEEEEDPGSPPAALLWEPTSSQTGFSTKGPNVKRVTADGLLSHGLTHTTHIHGHPPIPGTHPPQALWKAPGYHPGEGEITNRPLQWEVPGWQPLPKPHHRSPGPQGVSRLMGAQTHEVTEAPRASG